jgi:hypothetical protein
LSHRTTSDDLNKLLSKLQREQREQIAQYRTATVARAKGGLSDALTALLPADATDDVPVRQRPSDSVPLVKPWGGEAFRAGEGGTPPPPAWFTKLKPR